MFLFYTSFQFSCDRYFIDLGQECGYSTCPDDCFGDMDEIYRLIPYDQRLMAVSSCDENNLGYLCQRNILITNGFAAYWYITVGYPCGENHNDYLDMEYDINITSIPNPQCYEFKEEIKNVNNIQFNDLARMYNICSAIYPEFSTINLFGWNTDTINEILSLFLNPLYANNHCYQHNIELGCRALLPRCVNRTIEPVCIEMLHEFNLSCFAESKFENPGLDKLSIISWTSLGSFDNSDCFYKPVICDEPFLPNSGLMINHNTKTDVNDKIPRVGQYQGGDVIQLECIKSKYVVQGSQIVTCTFNGSWSDVTPTCIINPVIVPVSCSIVVLIAITAVIALCVYFRLEIRVLVLNCNIVKMCKDHKVIDASYTMIFHIFVTYCLEDMEFIKGKLLPRLDLSHRVCTIRNFKPGNCIGDNIVTAMQQSHRTLIVLSESYLNRCILVPIYYYMTLLLDHIFKSNS